VSLRVGEVPDRVDVAVIGSGFGGAVIAEKLAGADLTVCVLERGKAYPPGTFPRAPGRVATNFWDPRNGLHGLFDVWSFRGIDAIVASGLGGGSLIYANVMLRKPETWFRQPHPYRPGVEETWSFTRAELEPHYDAVERFLQVQPLPTAGVSKPLDPAFAMAKVMHFHAAATGDVRAAYAPLAVRFRDAADEPAIGAPIPEALYPNMFGRSRRTCRLCGECDTGCNDGAKSSLDHTYLSAASHRGASLHERTEVRTIVRRSDGRFDIGVVVRRPEDEGWQVRTRTLPVDTIVADRVVVAAGTLGSTHLLLRNAEALGISNPALGTRFCGNGDLLGFILNVAGQLDGWTGPVITSYLQFPDESDTGSPEDYGMYIQDAGYPEFAAWLVETAIGIRRFPSVAKLAAAVAISRLRGRQGTSLSDKVSALLGRPLVTTRGMPVLGMGMDVPDGTLYLRRDDDGMLESTWSRQTSLKYFETLRRRMEALADALGGDFVVNPTYHLNRVVTVHPLGGCPAATDKSRGVVDGYGRVRGVPGLRVADGSIFPGPIGANPSLTIAAFADRVAEDMLTEGVGRNGGPDG